MATTTDVPGVYDVALDGTGYIVDTQYLEAFRDQTIDPIRRQADNSGTVGEATLNPEGFWRRSPESWHKGAGQSRYDASDSDPDRFADSYGVNVWTEGRLSMLRESEDTGAGAALVGASIAGAIESGGRLVAWEPGGASLFVYKSIGGTPSVVTVATTNSDVDDVTANDTVVYYVDGNILYQDTIFTIETGTGSPVAQLGGASNIQGVRFINDRLFCTDTSGNLYDISSLPGSLPTALGNLGGTGFFDGAFADGYFYFVGRLQNVIYKTSVNSAGTSLEVLTTAATLPSGESGDKIYGYLNFVVVKNYNEIRLGVVGETGDLTLSASFLQNEMWGNSAAGWGSKAEGELLFLASRASPYHSGYYSLIAINLSVINDALEPAWAPHIHAPAASVPINFLWGVNSEEFFMIANDGSLLKSTAANDYLTAGRISMGEVSFGTRENKVFLDPSETVEDGSINNILTTPDGTGYINTDVATAEPTVTWEMQLGPTVAGDDMTLQYPILRALPAPSYVEQVTVPILLHSQIEPRAGGQLLYVDIEAELANLRSLRDAGTLIDYQDGGRTVTAQVVGVDFIRSHRDELGDTWQGTALTRLKVLP